MSAPGQLCNDFESSMWQSNEKYLLLGFINLSGILLNKLWSNWM